MKFKTISLSVFLLMVISLLAACGSENTNNSGEEVQEINIAYGNQPDEPIDKFAQKWKELAEEESDGQLELNLYPSSQLGDEKDVTEQAINGDNVIVLSGYDFLMEHGISEAGILVAPYLVDSTDDLFELTETDWYEDIENKLDDQGIEVMANVLYGERHLMTDKEINTPEDLKGMKIRVPDNDLYTKMFSAMGAKPTPTPLDEMYTGIQQGTIDGAENPLPVLEGAKVDEVTNNLALTGHTSIISPLLAGTEFIDSLPDDLVEILKETGEEASEYEKPIVEEDNEKIIDKFEDEGIEVNEVDTEAFEESTEEVYEEYDWVDLRDKLQDSIGSKE